MVRSVVLGSGLVLPESLTAALDAEHASLSALMSRQMPTRIDRLCTKNGRSQARGLSIDDWLAVGLSNGVVRYGGTVYVSFVTDDRKGAQCSDDFDS